MVKFLFILEAMAVVFCISVPNLSCGMVVSQPPGNISIQNVFHVNFTGPTWVVVNISFSEPTDVMFEIHTHYFLNESRDGGVAMVGELQNGSLTRLSIPSPPNKYDKYFQFHFGPFNWNYHHSNPSCCEGLTISGNRKNVTGSRTLIIVMNGSACSHDIWVNLSKNASISFTAGSEVFALERQDFGGNLNLGGRHGTLILNGRATITVQNTLFCGYTPDAYSCRGRERLSYRTPSGTTEWLFQTNAILDNPPIIETSTGFNDGLIFGEKGIWTFKANMLAYGLEASNPSILLVGADITMP